MKFKFLHYIISVVAMTVAMSGCLQVDKDYDLSKINTDDVVVGDEFVAPVGKITTSPEELLGLTNEYVGVSKAIKTVEVPVTFMKEYSINASLDKGIVDALSADGSRSMKVTIVNPTELAFYGEIEFLDGYGQVVAAPFGKIDFQATSTNKYAYDISVETLDEVSQVESIRISCERKCAPTISVDDQQKIEIILSIVKTGGISLKN